MLEEKMKKPAVMSGAVIFLCFLLTSTGWLAWNSHMQEYMDQNLVNVCTMVAGYALQAVGIGLFACILRYKPSRADRALPAYALLHFAFLVPVVICTDFVEIAAGLVMEIFCGLIAGYYLFHFSRSVPLTQRARVFGYAYGLSILASWLLAETGGSSFYTSKKLLIVCGILTAVIIYIVKKSTGDNCENAEDSGHLADGYVERSTGNSEENRRLTNEYTKEFAENAENAEESRRFVKGCTEESTAIRKPLNVEIMLRGVLVLLLGIGIGCGFTFVPQNVGETINLELSRLVYAVSLVIAGVVTDRSRKNGAVCALTVLVFPFVMLCLKQEPIPAVVFWMLSYFAFGFYSIYRIILYSDLNIMYLSGFGLMIGRIGDAAGEAISLALYERPIIHVGVVAVISVAAIFVFFHIYHVLYISGEVQVNGEKVEGAGNPAAFMPNGVMAEETPNPAAVSSNGAAVNETQGSAASAPNSVAVNEAQGSVASAPNGAAVNETQGSAASASNGVMVNNLYEAAGVPEHDKTAQGVQVSETARTDRNLLQSREDRFYRFSAQYELSQRERDILSLILSEKKNYEIADTLYISENTVKFHVRNILKKTGCKNRNELVLFYAANP